MAELTANEVLANVQALRSETNTLRDEALRYERVHGMYYMPPLPKDLIRKEAVYMLSPDVMHEAREIKAAIMTFETEIQCNPTARNAAGTIPEAAQTQADNLEKAAAIFLSRLDPDLTLLSRIIDGQLVEPLSIVVLELGAVDKPDGTSFPWKAYDVEIDGVGFLHERGLPTVFAREYSQFISKIEKQYSGRRDGPNPGAGLGFDAATKGWRWLSDDFTDRATPHHLTESGSFRKADMAYYDDNTTIYHVAKNTPKEGFTIGPLHFGKTSTPQGEMVWSGPNPWGRSSAFLIGSNVRKGRAFHDTFLPYLLPLITISEQDSYLDSIRATAARNRASPREYWNPPADFLSDYMKMHQGQMPPPVEWAEGRTPVGMGELKSRPVDVDPDMNLLSQRNDERRQRYNATNASLRDPEVMKNSTAAVVLSAYDAEAASKSIIIGPEDTFRRQMVGAWEHSIGFIAKKYGLSYAKFDLAAQGREVVSGGTQLAAGDTVNIDSKSFEDCAHEWSITTTQRSRGQIQAEIAGAIELCAPLPDGRPGIGTYKGLFKAAHISDVEAYKVDLAKEALMYEAIDPLVLGWVKQSLESEIELDSGTRVELLGAAQSPLPPTDPNAPAGQPSQPGSGPAPPMGAHTTSPTTEPAVGGSGPNLQGG